MPIRIFIHVVVRLRLVSMNTGRQYGTVRRYTQPQIGHFNTADTMTTDQFDF